MIQELFGQTVRLARARPKGNPERIQTLDFIH
jgi:hypothetical protein